MIDMLLLKDCAPFAALSHSELELVAGLAVEQEYEAGSTIFQEGSHAGQLFVLREGKVALQMKLRQGPANRSISVDIVSRNELFGWSAIVEPNVYTLTAVCLQRAKVLSIDGNGLWALFDSSPNIGHEVLKGLVRVIASRLEDTRRVLISERLLAA